MRDAVIVSAVRTAVGKAPRGTLRATQLARAEMKEPGIGVAITLSFFLHVAIVTISLLIGRGLYTRKLVPTYVVSLVSPSQTAGSEKVSPSGAAKEAAAPEIAKPAEKPRVEPHVETRMKKESYTTTVKDRIEELRAIQKLEKLMALRKIIDIGTKGA